MKLTEGMKAPDFTLQDHQDGQVSLSDLRGKKVLLSFHPLAWTSVCTDQMRALEVNHERFENLNTVPLGISIDHVPGKKVWGTALGINKLKLLSDFHPFGQMAKDYDLFVEQIGASGRANILIDEEGIIRWIKVYRLSELPNIEEVFSVLESM